MNNNSFPSIKQNLELKALLNFISAFFNYAQTLGDDSRTNNNNIPIRYVGLSDISYLRPFAKQIARVFALMSKDQMTVVYPNTGAGVNLRDYKPLYGIVGYTQNSDFLYILFAIPFEFFSIFLNFE